MHKLASIRAAHIFSVGDLEIFLKKYRKIVHKILWTICHQLSKEKLASGLLGGQKGKHDAKRYFTLKSKSCHFL